MTFIFNSIGALTWIATGLLGELDTEPELRQESEMRRQQMMWRTCCGKESATSSTAILRQQPDSSNTIRTSRNSLEGKPILLVSFRITWSKQSPKPLREIAQISLWTLRTEWTSSFADCIHWNSCFQHWGNGTTLCSWLQLWLQEQKGISASKCLEAQYAPLGPWSPVWRSKLFGFWRSLPTAARGPKPCTCYAFWQADTGADKGTNRWHYFVEDNSRFLNWTTLAMPSLAHFQNQQRSWCSEHLKKLPTDQEKDVQTGSNQAIWLWEFEKGGGGWWERNGHSQYWCLGLAHGGVAPLLGSMWYQCYNG